MQDLQNTVEINGKKKENLCKDGFTQNIEIIHTDEQNLIYPILKIYIL